MSPGLARTIATVGGIGWLPRAPGTWASAATIPLAWGAHAVAGFAGMLVLTVVVTAVGWWAVAALVTGDEDPSEIVIDEVAGMLVALWPLSAGLTMMEAAPSVWPWPGWVLGFVLFRALDILKPPPVSTAERIGGATGVMLDDLVAGLLTALVAVGAAAVAHGWI